MKLQQFGIVAVAIGVVLLVASFTWTSVIPDQAVWSREQATSFQKASAKLHNDLFDKELSKEDLAKSRAKFDENRKLLDRAIAKKHTTPVYLRIAGLIAGGLGLGLILIERGKP